MRIPARFLWAILLCIPPPQAKAVECSKATTAAPPKLFQVQLGFSFITSFFSVISAVRAMEKASEEAEGAKAEFEDYLIAHPEPSPELDEKYSKAKNLKVFATRLYIDLFKELRDGDKSTNFSWDAVYSDKAFTFDLDSPCDDFAKVLSAEQKRGVIAVRARNKARMSQLLDEQKGYIRKLFEDKALPDEEFDRLAEEALSHLKELYFQRYAEVFQLRKVLGPEPMKVYLSQTNSRLKRYSMSRSL